EQAVQKALAAAVSILRALQLWKVVSPPGAFDWQARFGEAMLAAARAHKTLSEIDFTAAQAALQRLIDLPGAGSVGSAFEPPPQQLLGELLLEAQRPKEVLAAFEVALARHSLHSRALLGVARAAKATGQ